MMPLRLPSTDFHSVYASKFCKSRRGSKDKRDPGKCKNVFTHTIQERFLVWVLKLYSLFCDTDTLSGFSEKMS